MSRRIRFTINGKRKRNHTIIAEKALGRELKAREEIHHVDYNDENDTPSNLVICPSREYHALLHVRTDAWMNCGNANWRKCKYCHVYDAPENMTNKNKRTPTGDYTHKICNRNQERIRTGRPL